MGRIMILVKREVQDHAIHYALAVLMGCLASAIIYVLYKMADPVDGPIFAEWMSLFILGQLPCLMVLDAMSLARVQIAGDRRARVSAFICTLTPTRGQLLVAKWISGLLWIVLAVGPLLVTLALNEKPSALYLLRVKPLMIGAIVMQATGYAMGQQLGFLENKGLVLVVGALFLCVLASLVIIKGLAMPCYALMAVLTVALSVRSWWAFHHMAL